MTSVPAGLRLPSAPSRPQPVRPRVVHVIPALPVGGVEAVVRALAFARQHRGWPTEVIALLPTGSPKRHAFVDQLRSDGVRVSEVRSSHRGYLTEARAIAAIGGGAPTVIHTHKFRGDVAGYLGSRGAAIALVATVHGFTRYSARVRCYQWLDRRLLRRFDAIIAVSSQLRAQMIDSGIAADRVHRVHNALLPSPRLSREEARERLGLDFACRVVGWVGRLSMEKGLDLLLDAIYNARRRDYTLVVVGDGPERERLTVAARRLGLEHHVRFAGALPQAAALLNAFDAVVLSSRHEGCPTVVLEAMTAGVPIAAFAVGGVPEMLTTETARLVAPGDTAALADALLDCLDNVTEARLRAGMAQLEATARFDLDRWVDRVENIYFEAIRRREG